MLRRGEHPEYVNISSDYRPTSSSLELWAALSRLQCQSCMPLWGRSGMVKKVSRGNSPRLQHSHKKSVTGCCGKPPAKGTGPGPGQDSSLPARQGRWGFCLHMIMCVSPESSNVLRKPLCPREGKLPEFRGQPGNKLDKALVSVKSLFPCHFPSVVPQGLEALRRQKPG